MTGIGEARMMEYGYDISVSLRSVNHRFLNLQIRMPQGYYRYESAVRDAISKHVARGKIDANIYFLSLPEDSGEVVVNRGYAVDLCKQITSLAAELNIPDGLTAERLIRMTDVFTSIPSARRDCTLENVLMKTLDKAIESFLESRQVEGTHLATEMKQRTMTIASLVERLKQHAAQQVPVVRERLTNALERIGNTAGIDARRLEEEVLLWAVRSDITEELTRLSGHLARLSTTLDSNKAIGKELDFIIQELHREVTTIGSKSVLADINQLVISVKMEIEKLREQVQNLE